MKVKNIMFSGFAAAILMGVVAEANAAPVAVASKGYVDSVAGTLTELRTDDKNNLVDAINELKDDKLDPVDAAGAALTDGEYYKIVTQATDGQLTIEKGDLATTIASGNMIAPTTDAVHKAIQGVSGQTAGLDLLPGVGGDGKYVKFVEQENGQVRAQEGKIDTELNGESVNPVTNAVITAGLAGKQGILNSNQLNAVNSTITAAKVAQYDEYATTKQDKLIEGKFININEETGEITTTYRAGDNITIDQTTGAISATGLQKTLKQGNFINIAEDGTITTTYAEGSYIDIDDAGKISATISAGNYITIDNAGKISGTISAGENVNISESGVISATDTNTTYTAGDFVAISDDNVITTTYTAGDNITIGTDGTINTKFPEMPTLCSEEGTTCVLTSEGGEFAWVPLTKPVAGAVENGRPVQNQFEQPQ